MRPALLAVLGAVALLALPAAGHAADAAAGETAFNDLGCSGCHIPGEYDQAPPLAGVYGRKIAGAPNWPYCEAIKARGAKGEVWDDKSLDAFLSDTQAFAPSCAMSFKIDDAAKRADLAAYLKTLK
jgi:cytochrome c